MLHKPNPRSLARIVPLFSYLLLAGIPVANCAQAQIAGQVRFTWIEILHPTPEPYDCMIVVSSTTSPGGEGTGTAILTITLFGDGTAAHYDNGWHSTDMGGLMAVTNQWQS